MRFTFLSTFMTTISLGCMTVWAVAPQTTNPSAARTPALSASNARQDQQAADPASTLPGKPLSFQSLVKQIQTNDRKINRLYTTMPIGFPVEQQQYLKQIDELKSANAELTQQMHSAALRSFRANPNQDPQVTQVVFELVTQKLDGTAVDRHFDPSGALEIATLMMANGLDSPQIAYQAFRATYALQDFQQARGLLKKIEASGAKLNEAILEKLFSSDEKWQREMTIRQSEAIADDLPRVQIRTTEGDIVIELFENQAPKTVGNFINLVEAGFYDGLDFHLVRPGLLSQAGCPIGDGTGSAGYMIPCETDGEDIRHFFAGTVGMANNGKDTGSSQFFISHQPNANFDGNYTAFGRVIEGLPVVFQLETVDNTISSSDDTEPSKIISATVIRKREHSYLPTRLAEKPNPFGQDLSSNPDNNPQDAPDTAPTRSGK